MDILKQVVKILQILVKSWIHVYSFSVTVNISKTKFLAKKKKKTKLIAIVQIKCGTEKKCRSH